jgi:hypothetical protein
VLSVQTRQAGMDGPALLWLLTDQPDQVALISWQTCWPLLAADQLCSKSLHRGVVNSGLELA